MSTMKAIRFHDYGGPDVLQYEDLPVPTPQDDEVLVHVRAVGVNPVDWKLRSGVARKHVQLPLPVSPGGDISGVIAAVGRGVSGLAPGDEVYAMIGLTGAYAQYVCTKAAMVAPKPQRISHLEAASVPLAALTAWQGLFEHGQLAAGQAVLIHAAAGGVGSFAVQLAHERGARVTGTASSRNAAYLRELGATSSIDYTKEAFEAKLRDLDLVLDLLGAEYANRSLVTLKKGGALVQVTPGTPDTAEKAAALGVRAVPMRVRPDGTQLREIAGLVDAGKLRTTVAEVFKLEDAGRAQEASQTGHVRGKIVLDCRT